MKTLIFQKEEKEILMIINDQKVKRKKSFLKESLIFFKIKFQNPKKFRTENPKVL